MGSYITSAAAKVSSYATNAPGLGSMENAHLVAGLDGFTGLNQWCQLLNLLKPSSTTVLIPCFHVGQHVLSFFPFNCDRAVQTF